MKLAAVLRDMSIRRKLMLITLVSAGAALLLAALMTTWHQWIASHAELEKITHSQAIIVASNSTSALLFNDPKSAGQNLEAFSAFDNIEFAALYDRQGKLFAMFVAPGQKPPPSVFLPAGEPLHTHTLPSLGPDAHTDSDAQAHLDAEEHTHTHAEHDYAANALDVIHAIDAGRERIGTIYVRSSLSPIYQQMAWSTAVMAGTALAGLGLALLLVAILQPAITGPMAALVGLMGRVSSEKNYALRAESQGKDEVALLGREFNDMLAQIQARDEALAEHRAHLEQEVAKRTASLTEAQRIAHLGNWEWDIVNDTLSWSDEIYRIFGLTPQQFEATYKGFMQSVHPDDRQRLEEGVRKVLEQPGQTLSQDHRILLPDGSVRHVHEQAEVSFGEDGQAIRMVGTVQDITEATLAAEQIRKQQELTTRIIETIPLRVFWKDHDLRYLGCNTLFAKDAGWIHPDELIGKTDFELSWKDQAEIYGADDRLVMDSNTPKLSYDEPQTTPDGGQIWLRSSKVPLRNDANEAIGLLGIYEDITGHKLAAQALEESERKFRAIVDATVDGILVADAQTHQFIIANRAICDMLGYPMDEVYRLGLGDIHPAEALAGVQKTFERQLTGEIRMSQNMPLKRKDGSVFFADVSASPIVLQGHTYLVGAFHDVTERKLAEETVEQLRHDLAMVLESAGEGICTMDANGNHVMVNPSAARMFGYEVDEMIGRHSHSLWHHAKADGTPYPAEECPIYATTRDGVIRRNEHEVFWRKDGTCFPVEYIATPIWSKGAITGTVVVFHDIAERRRMEEKIHQLNEELESKVQERTRQLLEAQEDLVRKEKLATLGQVAGSVGHELRNPLGVMNNAVYFLQTVLSDADETTKEYLNIIKDEIADSERIVSDLLDSVRTKPPRPEAVGVAELIGHTLNKLTLPATVTVSLDIPQTLSPLQVDAQQIQQVFRNLISNGVEAMPEGGTLEIRAVENKPEGQVVVSVRDTGTGIAPDILPRLFQPLFTTKSRGIGLGLVVVKNLTEANGGVIAVQSEVGQGTTFTVTLPAVHSFVEEG